MTDPLETAAQPEGLRRIAIEPLTRVEGHGKVTLLIDAHNRVQQARLHIVEFRGFEKFIEGRPYWEVPVIVQRLCGICPVSHQLAAAKAMDQVIGARLTPTAEKLRRLMHYGQLLQSHALHFFYLAAPDLLFGFDADPLARNVAGLAAGQPDLLRKGIALRKYGQEVIRLTAGKRIHGTGAIPGGVNKALSSAERDALRAEIDTMIRWAEEAVELVRKLFAANGAAWLGFAHFEAPMLCLVRGDGALDYYDGALRARAADGTPLLEQFPVERYWEAILEDVKPWSYMKFPFLRALGDADRGWYCVGPLARLRLGDRLTTPRAEAARQDFLHFAEGAAARATLGFHWARMIEMLHAAEVIRALLDDADLCGTALLAAPGARQTRGVGVIEAPRGTLIHHYRVDEQDQVIRANLIVATTHNNQAMNAAIRAVARERFDGRTIDEGLLNAIEVAIRAFDPCLSCATHALGRMPLEIELVGADGTARERAARAADGRFLRL